MEKQLNLRIEQLESKVAFQELTIEQLNQMVIQLQLDCSKLKEQLTLISKKMQTVQTSNIAAMSEETPPPHY